MSDQPHESVPNKDAPPAGGVKNDKWYIIKIIIILLVSFMLSESHPIYKNKYSTLEKEIMLIKINLEKDSFFTK